MTEQQVKNALQEVGGHVSLSLIKGLHDQNLGGFTTICKPLVKTERSGCSTHTKGNQWSSGTKFSGLIKN